jgi:hypothetical protein
LIDEALSAATDGVRMCQNDLLQTRNSLNARHISEFVSQKRKNSVPRGDPRSCGPTLLT